MGLRRAAARFRAPVRVAPRCYWVARRDSGRQRAPCCAVIAWRDSISGADSRLAARVSRGVARLRAWARAALRSHRSPRRDFGRGFALRCAVAARLNAIPGAGSRRAARAARHDSGCGSAPCRAVIAQCDSCIYSSMSAYSFYIPVYSSIFLHIPARSEYSQYLLNMLEFVENCSIWGSAGIC